MAELHAAITAYLRDERQRDGTEQDEVGTFFCRFYGEPYIAGGDDFHLNELIAVGACLDRHQRVYTAEVVPHCRACGEPITAEDGPFAQADMQLRR